MIIIIFSSTISISSLFAEEPLELFSKEGSHSVGHDQNLLGIDAYKKQKFYQALKHFQTASVVDRKKGKIFFNIGLTFHKMGKHLESAKHFQWALKLSSNNKKISKSQLIQQHHCDNNSKIPCNLTKPEKHKLNLSDVVPPDPYISQSSDGGGGGY
jgi:tetratricopeptide (TPR) repeat protein